MRHRFFVLLVWLACALPALAAAPPGFVSAAGKHLFLDGAPYYYAGANSYNLFTLGDGYSTNTLQDIENKFMSKSKIDARLAAMAADGIKVVRTWGFSHETWHGFEPAKGVYSEPQFMLFDYLMQSARSNGLRVIVTLENYWDAYGGIRDRLAWEGLPGGTALEKTAFYTHPGCKEGYRNYLQHFITRTNHYSGIAYKDDPTLFAWELMNEPRYQGAGEDGSGFTLRAWVDEMAGFVKRLDPNHMVSAGLEGHQAKYGFGGDEGNPFVYIHQSPYLDFCTAHPYPDESWANLSPVQAATLVGTWINDAHNLVGKPFIMEEFNTHTLQAEYWTAMYGKIEELQAAGDNFWQYADASKNFDVAHGDPLLASPFKPHADRMAARCGALVENTAGATAVTASSATLNGSLLFAAAAPTLVWVYWGGTDGGTNQAGWEHALALGAREEGAFSAPVAGLSSDTTYYYRSYVSNALSSGWAKASASFITPGGRPVITNSPASEITTNSARLNANLTSAGLAPTTVWVCWGTNDAGTAKSNWASVLAYGERAIGTLSTNLSGLAPGTRHFYRHLATNSYGETWAPATESFLTLLPNATYIWDGGGGDTSWNNANNWSNVTSAADNAGYPNSAGAVARCQANITISSLGDPVVTLGQFYSRCSIAASTANLLLFDNGTAPAVWVASNSTTMTIGCPVSLNTTLLLTNVSAGTLTFSAKNITGPGQDIHVSSLGSGPVFFDGGANTGNTFSNLYVHANSQVNVRQSPGDWTKYPLGRGTVFLENGTTLYVPNLRAWITNDLVLLGNATLKYNSDRADHARYAGAITGPGRLTVFNSATNPAGNTILEGPMPNTYTGGTVVVGTNLASTLTGVLVLAKNHALGSGDVLLANEYSLLELTDGGATDDRIDDNAALSLCHAGTNFSRIVLDANVVETVRALRFDGIEQAAGTWGSSSSSASHKNDDWFAGSGVLVVTGAPLNPDSDGDGLADAWELANFGNLTTANATSDFDHDGQTDLQEYRAGTLPTNSASAFAFTESSYNAQAGALVLKWQSVAGKQYGLEQTTNVSIVAWQLVVSNLLATPPVNTYTTPPAAPYTFYRVSICSP